MRIADSLCIVRTLSLKIKTVSDKIMSIHRLDSACAIATYLNADFNMAWIIVLHVALKASGKICLQTTFYYLIFFKENISIDISCGSSAWQKMSTYFV